MGTEKRRKLFINDYSVKTEAGEEFPFLVAKSLISLMFNEDLRLNFRKLIESDRVAKLLEECNEDYILLSEEDFGIVRDAVQKFEGYDRNALELINRVNGAELIDVDVKEKK
jgi:hypothetical protein